MLLKRSIVLAAAVLLFIVAFIVYSEVSHARMEEGFRAEREKFNVEGVTLTASPSAIATPASSPRATPDTNTPVGPVPPPSSSAPDSTPAPSTTPPPAAPDSNSTPVAPSSTMNDSGTSRPSFFQLASYRPSDSAAIHVIDMAAGQTNAPAVAPTTNPAPASGVTLDLYTTKPTTGGGTVRIVDKPAPTATAPSASTKAAPAPAASTANNPGSAVSASREGSVIVLLYHQFKPAGYKIPPMFRWTMNVDVFESEMKYIHDNGYHVIPMADLLKFLKHEITVPPNSVCITIDDGYKSAIVYAAPILKQYGYPWTFFIYPDFITVSEGSGAASWNDLLALQAEGIDIESHSMTHPNLKLHHQKVKGVWHNFTPEEYAAWLANETAGSKALLEQKMGKTITCFAYPYGEYNKQVEDAAISAGYEAIFTVADNPVHETTNLHSIGRYTITREEEKNFAAYLRQGALGLANADPAPGATITNPRPVITATLGYPGALDPKSIITSVRDYGVVRHDFDPQTNTVRLYLPRDLIASVVLVNIRVEDASTKQVMVANWHFNYEPDAAASTPVHTPIAPATNAPASSSKTTTVTAPAPTNAPAATEPEPLEKSAVGTPLDTHPAPRVSPD